MKKLLVLLGIVALLVSSVPMSFGASAPIAITGMSWYSENSTSLAAPGYSYVPLVATFVTEASLTALNVSFNFTSEAYFTYSYVQGPNKEVRDYFDFPATKAGGEYAIYQLTNISASAPTGIYQITLDYSYTLGNTTVKGNVSSQVGLLGTIDIIPQEAYFGTPGSPISATSYESNIPLTVYLVNNGNSAATNVTVSYTPQSPFSGTPQKLIVPAFPAYTSIPVTFTVSTGAAGIMNVQEIGLTVFGLSRSDQFTVRLASFPYIVPAAATFATGSVVAGQGMNNVPLQFYLEEDSSVPATNISVSYSPSWPLEGISQRTTISAIPAFTSIPVTFLVNISGNSPSFYQNLTLFYNGTSHRTEFQVIVPGYSNVSMVNYFTDPPYIYQNEQFVELNVELINGGSAVSGPLNISLTSNAFQVSTNPYHLPGLPSGKLLNLTFLMNASGNAGSAQLYLHINSRTLPLTEKILNKGSVEISSSPITVASGTNGNLFVFTARNDGNVTLMDLDFHILTPDVFYIDVPSSNPLGSLTANNVTFARLSPGQTITVTFVMDVESAASPGSYPSQLVMTYMMNNSTSQFLVTHNFNVSVQETAIQRLSSTTGLTYIVLLLAVIIVVVFSVLIIRRRRKKN
ncbi:MAG: hypothetical protein M1290_01240 [Candidatus Thermoplasmatota archaeon]|jgi:hypothetical protein|nr:hypothetical protein [Candidatus Thermoplasmatota archaeon]